MRELLRRHLRLCWFSERCCSPSLIVFPVLLRVKMTYPIEEIHPWLSRYVHTLRFLLLSRLILQAHTYPYPDKLFRVKSFTRQHENISPGLSLFLFPPTAFPKMVIVEAMGFMAQDYRKRFQTALAMLTDMYVADVAAAAAAAAAAQALKQEKGKSIKRAAKLPKPRGFDLYDEALLSLLTTLSGSLASTWRQKLFTQTLLECPRVPPAALELVCTLCDLAAQPHDVQTGGCEGVQCCGRLPCVGYVGCDLLFPMAPFSWLNAFGVCRFLSIEIEEAV